jgi:hypothetical protein
MRWVLLLWAVLGTSGGNAPALDLGMIDELNECVQLRFQTPPIPAGVPDGPALGMSRIARPPSFGEHFVPRFDSTRDFRPENDREKKALAALEAVPVQVGFYLFGRAIVDAGVETPKYRALKGPAALTRGTPRPDWYPTLVNTGALPSALPDWKAIYPLAQRAMKSFGDGGAGFETSIDSWQIAARPVVARQGRCLACHNVALGQAVGGVLYAFRRDGSQEAPR